MTKFHRTSVLLFLIICLINTINAQDYSIDIILKNAPENTIYLGTVKGDNYTIIDSAKVTEELIQFKLSDKSVTGIYRIKLGYVSERNKRNDVPQTIDLIFNKENVVLESDFFSPDSDTRVIQSAENHVWLSFIKHENNFRKKLTDQERDLNYNWTINNSEKAIEIATEYNQLQIERDLFITETIKADTNLFAAKLIKTYREPLLDGYLTKAQRNIIFQKEYLNAVDFSDETLINSQVYTDKIFSYLMSYNQSSLTQQKREEAYFQAVENVFNRIDKNKAVFEFVKDYLEHGFEVLQMPKIVEHISKKEYAGVE